MILCQEYMKLDWLGRKGSNLRMPESKSGALPLGDAPLSGETYAPLCGGIKYIVAYPGVNCDEIFLNLLVANNSPDGGHRSKQLCHPGLGRAARFRLPTQDMLTPALTRHRLPIW